jgi:hypothetical protein
MAQVNSENSTAMPAVSTRRRFLSQAAGVAAGGAVLALGTIPPTLAAAPPGGLVGPAFGLAANDPKDEIARLEQAVEILRTRHVCDGWKMDEAGAERALRYFRAGCPDDDDEWGATVSFISSHGLSFDWICKGNVGPMVCEGAKHSEHANSIAAVSADPVFAIIETHRAADAALASACAEKSRLEGLGDRDADGGTEAAHQAEWSALADLVEAVPTTIAGVIASMRYVEPMANDGSARISQGEIVPLLANLAEALESLTVTS